MKTKWLTYLVTVCFFVATINPIHADPEPEPNPEPQYLLAPACFVIGAGLLAGAGIWILTRSCKPKYFCLKDSEGTHWVGTATKKEREVNDWTVVSGPYESVEAGTNNCPPKPSQMIAMASEPIEWTIQIQESTNGIHWNTIIEWMDDPSNLNHTFYITNLDAASKLYRAAAKL